MLTDVGVNTLRQMGVGPTRANLDELTQEVVRRIGTLESQLRYDHRFRAQVEHDLGPGFGTTLDSMLSLKLR